MHHLNDVFCVPIHNHFLLYAPLHQVAALVNAQTIRHLQALSTDLTESPNGLSLLINQFKVTQTPAPGIRTGRLTPAFLGIIPTRGCNLGCHYCDFAAPKHNSPTMSLDMARCAVDAYLNIVQETGASYGEIHFFGGEPFYAESVVHFVVDYALEQAAKCGITLHFEAVTNGVYSVKRCQWIADHFDTIVLSLDGLPEIHNKHRPALNDRGTFDVVARSARLFSEGPVELIVRSCVTDESVHQMTEFAQWIANELRPSTVCFETLVTSPLSQAADLTPPDPWVFANAFTHASNLLAEYGIQTVISTADLGKVRASFCPVGHDALIVSPDGAVDACYLLQQDWEASGLNMRLGNLNAHGFDLDNQSIQNIRGLSVDQRSLCADCLCRYHCAGGCHVNHATNRAPGQFDDSCIQTPLITVAMLLQKLGQFALAAQWLADRVACDNTVWQTSDRLLEYPIQEAEIR